MTFEFKFPDVGEGIQEGEIVRWKVNVGDNVTQDQIIAEVETDKAVVEIPIPQSGTVAILHAKEGESIKVGAVMVTLDENSRNAKEQTESHANELEDKDSMPAQSVGSTSKTAGESVPTAALKSQPKKSGAFAVGDLEEAPDEPIRAVPARSSKSVTARVMATPKVKKLAKEKGIDITTVTGTGKDGRIVEADLSTTRKLPSQSTSSQEIKTAKHTRKYDFFGFVDREPLRGMRKTIARRMVESIHATAPVTHFDEADVTLLHGLREKVKDEYAAKNIKLTLLPFIIKAVIEGLRAHPRLNSTLEEDEIILKKYYNIGFAVDTGDGLLVPVIKEAQDKSVVTIAKEIQAMAIRAKERKLDPMDMKGGSFTITNVGSIGGLFATPIINPPEAAILALGRGYEKPVSVHGKIKVKFVIPLSLTFDHRILDGAEAARFVNKVKDMLQDPSLLLMESELGSE